MKKQLLTALSGLGMVLASSFTASAQHLSYNVLSFGAKADGHTPATQAIQHAIDAAAQAGGGQVVVPAGYYYIGQLFLKTGVELHLDSNATLLGTTNRMDYTQDKPGFALIEAQGQSHIAVTGQGTITGQGRQLVSNILQLLTEGKLTDPEWRMKRPTEKNRPMILAFKQCNDVKVTGVSINDAAGWVQLYKDCTRVLVDGIKVESVAYWNNDGIDIVDCADVRISNSSFNAADDAICLKSEEEGHCCNRVLVQNCVLRSSANGFKLGTGSVGGFKNITVNNLRVYNTYRSAIALEAVDGGFIDSVTISQVSARYTGNAIFIRLGHRNTDERYSTVNHIQISNVDAEIPAGKPDAGYPVEGPLPKIPPHNLMPASIVGIPGHRVQNVSLANIKLSYAGGGSAAVAQVLPAEVDAVPENIPGYPEFTMFGELPAWALFIRHAENITLSASLFDCAVADYRPSVVAADVHQLNFKQVKLGGDVTKPQIALKDVMAINAENTTNAQGAQVKIWDAKAY